MEIINRLLYFMVALVATTLGSMAGLGGGIIIKPILDFIGKYDLSTIAVLSSFTLLSMAIVSTIKYYRSGIRYDKKCALFFGMGSVIGGYVGKIMFSKIKKNAGEIILGNIQSFVLAIILVVVLYLVKNLEKIHKHNINNRLIMLIIGVSLGILCSFLGIGGGPLNVAILMIFFNMDSKKAAVHSVLIILVAQIASLGTVWVSTGFDKYDITVLPYMMIGGVIGGIIGSFLNKRTNNKTISKVFSIMLLFVILINIYNLFFK